MIRLLFLSFILPTFVIGRVTIHYPFHPVYVQTGHDLTLVCNSSQRYNLQWEWKTDTSTQLQEVIVPNKDGDFTIRMVSEEPSGHVESTLTKTDVIVMDTGNYICKDRNDESTYTVYVTVLHIIAVDVVAEEGDAEVTLQCKIVGFTNNIPQIIVTWSFKEMLVSTESGKYVTSFDNQIGTTTLTIRNPGREDGGTYGCTFALSTFAGPSFYASETINLNGESLPSVVSGQPQAVTCARSAFSLLLCVLLAAALN